MRTIEKGTAPRSLTEYGQTPGATYDGFDGKEELRQALVREQRGLCCYCQSRIRPEFGRMKIEHWRCQANYPGEALAYANLLSACMGGEGQRFQAQHCDTRKGDRDLTRSPTNPAHRVGELVRYLGDGTIASDDQDFQRDLNVILGLNLAVLKNNRKQVLAGFLLALGHRAATRAQLKRWERDWSGSGTAGDLRPYCQVVVYWLRKRLNRMVS